MSNTQKIAAIYRRAAAITEGATTADEQWWDDIREETMFLLDEAMGRFERDSSCSLPTLEELI